jgi:integrase
MTARCLRFLILTATRSAEARGCRWSEVDPGEITGEGTWTIPAARMKGRREHRVALSEPALAVLGEVAEVRNADVVFWGRAGVLDDNTLRDLLLRLGHRGVTVHGFRSSFADWAADHGHSSDAVEMALAHTVGSAVRRAYARSDLLEARRSLMQAWATFLTQPPAVVIPLRQAG